MRTLVVEPQLEVTFWCMCTVYVSLGILTDTKVAASRCWRPRVCDVSSGLYKLPWRWTWTVDGASSSLPLLRFFCLKSGSLDVSCCSFPWNKVVNHCVFIHKLVRVCQLTLYLFYVVNRASVHLLSCDWVFSQLNVFQSTTGNRRHRRLPVRYLCLRRSSHEDLLLASHQRHLKRKSTKGPSSVMWFFTFFSMLKNCSLIIWRRVNFSKTCLVFRHQQSNHTWPSPCLQFSRW